MNNDIVSLKDILSTFLDSISIKNGTEIHDFFSSWSKIAGDSLASHTKIIDIKNGVLQIEADHPGWMQIAQMNKKKILADIQKKYGNLEVTSISLRLKR